MPVPRAVFFDFDGVLADTENVHIAAWERTFNEFGWNVPAEVCARAAEVDDRAFLAELFAAHGVLDGDIAGWVRRKQSLTVALLSDAPRTYRGKVKNAQEAHEAIRPAGDDMRLPEELAGELASTDERRGNPVILKILKSCLDLQSPLSRGQPPTPPITKLGYER